MRLYVHWPFCVSRCAYCDFNTRVGDRRRMRLYLDALLVELDLWAGLLRLGDRPLESVYLGGGTPSTLSGPEASTLLAEVQRRFGLVEGAEVTVEVNPATWSGADFAAARAGGVGRFSIGVQSLHDPTLRVLRRAHTAAEALKAIEDARAVGASSVSADLLYGLPGMDSRMLLADLRRVFAAGVDHLSLYALTLSAATPLARSLARGDLSLPDEDETAEQYLAACEMIGAAGYEHYEISNFCLPGHRCLHNLAYWERKQYLGVGAGAHSLLGGYRLHNRTSLLSYRRELSGGRLPLEGCELIDGRGEREESIMLGLRTSRGVPEGQLAAEEGFRELLQRCGLMHWNGGRVTKTPGALGLYNRGD